MDVSLWSILRQKMHEFAKPFEEGIECCGRLFLLCIVAQLSEHVVSMLYFLVYSAVLLNILFIIILPPTEYAGHLYP